MKNYSNKTLEKNVFLIYMQNNLIILRDKWLI